MSARLEADVEELIDAGLDYCMVAVPTVLPRGSRPRAGRGRRPRDDREAAGAGHRRRPQTLAEAFADAGLVGAVGHIERYNPALQQARARLEAGELGDVYQVVTRRQGPFPARIADVGVVKDLGTHDIDLTAWVTQQTFTSVAARTASPVAGASTRTWWRSSGSWRTAPSPTTSSTGCRPLKERVTIVTGERGAFVADTLTRRPDLLRQRRRSRTAWDAIAKFRGVSEGDVIRYAIAKPEPLRVEHEKFRDAVLGKDADIVTMTQGLPTVRVAEAVLESAASGLTVDLE